MGLNKVQPRMGMGGGSRGMSRMNPNSLQPSDTGGMAPQADESGFMGSMGMVGDNPQMGITPSYTNNTPGFNRGPVNPTLSGRMRLPSQIAGQTGGNQWNGGAGIMQSRRLPFSGMPGQSSMSGGGAPSSAPGSASGSDINTLDSSFLGGKLSSVNTQPSDIRGLRGNLINYLNNPGQMNAQNEPDYGRTDVGTGERINGQYGSAIPSLQRGQVRDTSAGTTQSIDQLGPGSQFFNSINQQLQPVFDQRRAQALAQAKESAGNLTGSGFANILGNQVNKSIAEENATTLDYATRAAQMEQQRQEADANRSLNSQQGNQSSDLGFIQQLLGRSGQGLQADQLGLQRDTANQDNTRSYNQFQGTLDANRLSNIYNTRSATNNANAGRFSDNLGRLSTTGVSPNELVSSGGAGALAGPLGSLLGQGKGIGAGGSGLFGGGGTDGQGNYGVAGDVLGRLKGAVNGLPGMNQLNSLYGPNGSFLGQLGRGAAGYGLGQLIGNNTTGMTSNIAKSAGTGAAIGSVIPGVGTAVGGAVGAAVPLAKKAGSWLKKRFSDEQLKENVVPLGHGLYEYNFKGRKDREVGFLAQEVRKALPSAVSRDSSGYLKVDYSKTPSILNALSKADRL